MEEIYLNEHINLDVWHNYHDGDGTYQENVYLHIVPGNVDGGTDRSAGYRVNLRNHQFELETNDEHHDTVASWIDTSIEISEPFLGANTVSILQIGWNRGT